MKTSSLLIIAAFLIFAGASASADEQRTSGRSADQSSADGDGLHREGLSKDGLSGASDSQRGPARSSSATESQAEKNTKLPTSESAQDAGKAAEQIQRGATEMRPNTSGAVADANGKYPEAK